MSENIILSEHSVVVNNRESIHVTGIKSVDSFDEALITGTTISGNVINIEGSELSIKDVNLDKGKLEATGKISGFYYADYSPVSKHGIFDIFKRR